MKLPFGVGLNNLLVGLMETEVPGILQGMFIRYLHDISTSEAIDWINDNRRLWDMIGTEHREQIKTYAPKIKDWSWLTTEYLINSLSGDCPALASLFLGWPKARHWLNRQIEDMKREAGI